MSDIMDRLRQMADLFEAQQAPHNMVLHLRAAADEIERLRAENKKLRNALKKIAKVTYGTDWTWSDDELAVYYAMLFFRAQETARAALGGDK